MKNRLSARTKEMSVYKVGQEIGQRYAPNNYRMVWLCVWVRVCVSIHIVLGSLIPFVTPY